MCSEKYFVHCSVELLAVNSITIAMWYILICLLPTLFYLAVTYLQLVSTVFCFFQFLELVSDCHLVYQQPCERKIFDFFVTQVVQKVYSGNGPFSHILCSFLRATRQYIDRPERSRRNKMFQISVWGSIESRVTTLLEAARTPLSLAPDAKQKWISAKYRCHSIKTGASSA